MNFSHLPLNFPTFWRIPSMILLFEIIQYCAQNSTEIDLHLKSPLREGKFQISFFLRMRKVCHETFSAEDEVLCGKWKLFCACMKKTFRHRRFSEDKPQSRSEPFFFETGTFSRFKRLQEMTTKELWRNMETQPRFGKVLMISFNDNCFDIGIPTKWKILWISIIKTYYF